MSYINVNKRLQFLLASYIIATVYGGIAYAQSKKTASENVSPANVITEINREISDYNLDKAEELIENAEAANRRNKRKNPLPEGLDAAKDEIVKMREMLDRVESIEIIDSIAVAKKDAYKHIPLSTAAGRYLAPTVLPSVFPSKDASAVYATEDYSMIMWGARNPQGAMSIYQSDRLSDGTYAAPVAIDGEFGTADIDFPYLSSDGVTLYYASKHPDGLGGYDIYMTRREDGKFLLPQNIGMPYNSTSDDYMLVIDDVKNVGWWMTERNAAPGMVTIYTFIPQELRKNYPPDTPGLASLAKIKSYKLSWLPDKDYTGIIATARHAVTDNTAKESAFEFYIPSKGIYRAFSDFKSPQACELMKDYIELTNKYTSLKNHIARMRLSYSSGDKAVAESIVKGEKDIQTLEKDIKTLSNEIVRTEQSVN